MINVRDKHRRRQARKPSAETCLSPVCFGTSSHVAMSSAMSPTTSRVSEIEADYTEAPEMLHAPVVNLSSIAPALKSILHSSAAVSSEGHVATILAASSSYRISLLQHQPSAALAPAVCWGWACAWCHGVQLVAFWLCSWLTAQMLHQLLHTKCRGSQKALVDVRESQRRFMRTCPASAVGLRLDAAATSPYAAAMCMSLCANISRHS